MSKLSLNTMQTILILGVYDTRVRHQNEFQLSLRRLWQQVAIILIEVVVGRITTSAMILIEKVLGDRIPYLTRNLLHLSEDAASLTAFNFLCNSINR